MAARRRFLLASLLVFAAVLSGLYLGAGLWLPVVGRALIWNDGPAPADVAVVLAGDYSGTRLTGGAELARRGLVPLVLVSGPPGMYGVNEADAAIRYIVARGYAAEWFAPVYHTALSTRDEARVLVAELARRRVRRVLVVTSNYHSRRARRLFLAAEHERGGGPEIRMVATADPFYDPASWWRSRQGCKTAFLEWSKTFATMVGI